MRLLDHVDVIRSVPDGQCHLAQTLLNEFHYVSFLLRCHSAAHHTLAVLGDVNEPSHLVFMFLKHKQRLAFHH